MDNHHNNGIDHTTVPKSARVDRYQHHDYYGVDDLLTDEHKLARDAVRDWVKAEVSPIIEYYADKAQCPTHLFKGLAEIGAFGPSIPAQYGGGGMDLRRNYAGTGARRFRYPFDGFCTGVTGDVPDL
jgi:glutaryl-CoA dehydrogenase